MVSTTVKNWLRTTPWVVLGMAIGWSLDMTCVCNGASMQPTLQPGERIAFVPYAVLVAKRLVRAPLIQQGDVVVMKISDSMSVCKRVTRMTSDTATAQAWDKAHFVDTDEYIYAHMRHSHNSDNDTNTSSTYADDDNDCCNRSLVDNIPPPDKPLRAYNWDSCVERVAQPTAWLWLEGDNSKDSFDSRQCGAMPIECLRGKVLAVMWPHPRLVH